MRIGLVVYGDLDQVSGGYLYDRKLVEHLEARGDTVRVFRQPERPYPGGLVDNLNFAFWRRLASANLDVLLQDELNHASLALGNRWLRGQLDAPIVAIVHHLRAREQQSRPARALCRLLERLYLRTTDAHIFNSHPTKQSVEALAGRRPSVVAPPSGRRFGPPVSHATVDERAQADGPLRLLFVGNLIPRKRLHLLLDGLAEVPPHQWRLDVVGNPTAAPGYTAALWRRIQRLDAPSRVALRGQLPDDALQRLLRRSHALAVPSSHEGYGIVYVEAMGHGLPVLASPHGGVRDLVTDGETGRFVDAPAEIARAVRRWHRDRDRLAVLGRAATEAYCATPTWSETGARIASFLDRLAAPSSAALRR